ncbi:signal peptide peptidase SppA [Ferrimonas marina]|uniref:Protease-4 n=1 Tax=Ferrimonas marina TaxID=299255 RepID=A0A1M5NB18_9GAMM|nr:signal peptide peptidase SppA [Ferrimonas marina]SHG86183.1 protease-4 [Ferrimonas marina]
MSKQPSLIGRFFRLLGSVFNTLRKIIVNLVFFGLLGLLLVGLSQDDTVELEPGSALVLNLDGIVVEQKRHQDPLEMITQSSDAPREILLADILLAIREAGEDDRIAGLVLKPGSLQAGMAKLDDIGKAIEQFKESGKPVLMQAGYLDQRNYFLASFADEIQLNPGGMVAIEGMGIYRLYYKEVLEKLKVKTHLFRVGKYKSFAESYTRDSMSDEAKEANQAVLDDLWSSYVAKVSANRTLDPAALNLDLDQLAVVLEQQDGDFAKLALAGGLVDSLATDIEMRQALFDQFGHRKGEEHELKAIGLNGYLGHVRPTLPPNGDQQVAIIVAKGTILNGEQPAGTIGGVSTARLLREARQDDNVKAVVLRIDSGGGSAYASEQIRQEVVALQQAGKPVVASMGSVAASGGYWIAANADHIYAQPNTITGSIGIISLITTFEDAADAIGVSVDGVATTEMAGLSVLRPLPDGFKRILQLNMDKGYRDFIELVAEARGLSVDEVDNIAQGRVWSGQAALGIGLVDELGDLDQAVETAAALAQLDDFQQRIIGPTLSPEQEFIQQLLGEAQAWLPQSHNASWSKLAHQFLAPLKQQLTLDDPQHLYLLCLECGSEL